MRPVPGHGQPERPALLSHAGRARYRAARMRHIAGIGQSFCAALVVISGALVRVRLGVPCGGCRRERCVEGRRWSPWSGGHGWLP